MLNIDTLEIYQVLRKILYVAKDQIKGKNRNRVFCVTNIKNDETRHSKTQLPLSSIYLMLIKVFLQAALNDAAPRAIAKGDSKTPPSQF